MATAIQEPLAVSTRPRPLRFFGLIGIIFFCVAGGAYGLEDAVGDAGPKWALLALLIVPWLWSLPMALMTAELSTMLPADGGYVVWVDRAFGRFAGFQVGWWSWMASFADNALYPVLFAEYLKFWFPHMNSTAYWLVCLAVIALFTWLNIRGTQIIGFSSITFTLLVLAPFAAMVVLGLPHLKPSVWTLPHSIAWSGLLTVVLWNYAGWESAGCCAGEVHAPARTYPKALVVTVVLTVVAYVLPIAVGVCASQDWSQWKDGYFPDVARAIGGNSLGSWMMLGGLFSAVGLFSAGLLTTSRVPFAMAQRATLPAALTRLHPRYRTPWIAILVTSLGSALLIYWARLGNNDDSSPFAALLKIDMFLYALSLVLEFGALIRLRMREPAAARPYRVPGGLPGTILLSVPPVALCIVLVAICPHPAQLLGLGITVAGWLVYAIGFRKRPPEALVTSEAAE